MLPTLKKPEMVEESLVGYPPMWVDWGWMQREFNTGWMGKRAIRLIAFLVAATEYPTKESVFFSKICGLLQGKTKYTYALIWDELNSPSTNRCPMLHGGMAMVLLAVVGFT